MNKIIYTLLLFFIFTNVKAEAITTKGAVSCGTWISDKTQNKNGGWSSATNENWLIGYLSGLSVGAQKSVLQGVDGNSLDLWIENYCRTNPLKYLDEAGITLFIELKQQKGLK